MATLDADDLAAIAALFTAGTMTMSLKRLIVANDTGDPAFYVTNTAGTGALFSSGAGHGMYLSGGGEGGLGLSMDGGSGPGSGGLGIYGSDAGPAVGLYGPYSTPGPVVVVDATSANAGVDGGPAIRIAAGDGHGIAIDSGGTGNHDVALLGSGDVLGSISIDLTQPLSDVCAATVGGALNGAHATAWGKVVKDVAAKLLKVFSFGSTSVPMATFGLDDGSNPTTRTPQ